jgi:hypothetical protein
MVFIQSELSKILVCHGESDKFVSEKDFAVGLNQRQTIKHFFEHIKQNAVQKEIWLDSINGYQEHVHCLIRNILCGRMIIGLQE